MSYHADLTTKTDVACGPHVRAIGWLAKSHEFETGRADYAFTERLTQFVAQSGTASALLGFPDFMGYHQCEFCGRANGLRNFGVLGAGHLFIAPELVLHYVTAHNYIPPAEFVDAVLVSPLPESPEFLEQLQALRGDGRAGLLCPQCGTASVTSTEAHGAYERKCHCCQYREAGTVSYPLAEEDMAAIADMRIAVSCISSTPTAADLAALRSIFGELALEGMQQLRERLRNSSEIMLGPYAARVACSLIARATAGGLLARPIDAVEPADSFEAGR